MVQFSEAHNFCTNYVDCIDIFLWKKQLMTCAKLDRVSMEQLVYKTELIEPVFVRTAMRETAVKQVGYIQNEK